MCNSGLCNSPKTEVAGLSTYLICKRCANVVHARKFVSSESVFWFREGGREQLTPGLQIAFLHKHFCSNATFIHIVFGPFSFLFPRERTKWRCALAIKVPLVEKFFFQSIFLLHDTWPSARCNVRIDNLAPSCKHKKMERVLRIERQSSVRVFGRKVFHIYVYVGRQHCSISLKCHYSSSTPNIKFFPLRAYICKLINNGISWRTARRVSQ